MTAIPTFRRAVGLAVVRRAVGLAAVVVLTACAPIVRPAPFKGARTQVTGTTLLGPFDGQIVDEATGEPLQDAVVVGVWSYDRGDGFIGPSGSESVSVQTDEAGRYRIRRAPLRKRGSSLRLVSFHLLVYKRGYASYRSDVLQTGGARRDFTGRHNRIELGKWRERDSHADHLLFLAPPREVTRVSSWERREANLDLYAALGGITEEDGPDPDSGDTGTDEPAADLSDLWLEASSLIYPEDVAMRTGFDGEFIIEDLGDFPRSHFYHGVLFRAAEHEQNYDFSFRVWHKPSGGLDPVVEIFRENLPVEVSAAVTDETWVYEEPETGFRGVAFVDRESETGVLVSCGPEQCIDIDTAIILAKYIGDHVDQIKLVTAPEDGADPETEDGADPETEDGADPETEDGADPETEDGADPETAAATTATPTPDGENPP